MKEMLKLAYEEGAWKALKDMGFIEEKAVEETTKEAQGGTMEALKALLSGAGGAVGGAGRAITGGAGKGLSRLGAEGAGGGLEALVASNPQLAAALGLGGAGVGAAGAGAGLSALLGGE